MYCFNVTGKLTQIDKKKMYCKYSLEIEFFWEPEILKY